MNTIGEKNRGSFAGRVSADNDGKTLLNLGCGAFPHPAFVNVDLFPAPGVIGHDLRRGIPFPDRTYDFVYHSTMLSQLQPEDALSLMRECHRVLKRGGVLRVVDVDLENMCRMYLQKLEEAWNGNPQSAMDYEWMILELYDQPTREYLGGRMRQYVSQDPLLNEGFIYSRTGVQGKHMVAGGRSRRSPTNLTALPSAKPRFLTRLRAKARRLVLTALLGPQGPQALEIGRFRLSSGQVTYRYYDRYSLRRLFMSAGLSEIAVRTPRESAYDLWDAVNLDVTPEGETARPHTLTMEGIRAS